MTISARIIADSVASNNKRITTFILKYPRFIHAEFMTHRVMSRNSASSRAIPSAKFIDDIINDPAMPISWGKNCRGMQSNEELSEEVKDKAKKIWLDTRDMVIEKVKELLELGLHKQIANRMIEPWFNITVLATATEWDNFFKLRFHKDAQPEIHELAKQMHIALNNGEPTYVPVDGWHIPFGDRCEGLSFQEKLKVAVARAARVSYNNFEGEIDFQKDFQLHDDLKKNGHFSPFEHCAQALASNIPSGNFIGWLQYRKTIFGENGIENLN